MADQEQASSRAGEPAPASKPGASSDSPGGSGADPAAAALAAAQAAIDGLKAGASTPPPVGADDRAADALRAAQEAIAAAKSAQEPPASGATATAAAVAMPELQRGAASEPAPAAPTELELLSDVNLHVTIELGRTRMLVEDVLRLGEGSVVELDKPAGDPVDVYVNDRHVARGEVLVVNENFCVRISEIIENGAAMEGDRAAR